MKHAAALTQRNFSLWNWTRRDLVALLLLCIGILFYMDSRNKDYADVKGLETNPEEIQTYVNNNNQGLQEARSDGTSQAKGESTDTEPERPPKPVEPEEEDLNIEKDETIDDISRRGWQALNTNNPDIAIRLFKVVLQKKPNHFYASAGLGRAYESRGQIELAGRQYCNTAGIPTIDYDDMQYWLGYAEQVGTFCQ